MELCAVIAARGGRKTGNIRKNEEKGRSTPHNHELHITLLMWSST
jgi:hypothetical protein